MVEPLLGSLESLVYCLLQITSMHNKNWMTPLSNVANLEDSDILIVNNKPVAYWALVQIVDRIMCENVQIKWICF